jgi:hypothetical protein
MGALYLPLARCAVATTCAPPLGEHQTASWSTGRVVFRYVDEGLGRSHWFAADIEIIGAAGVPSPTPAAGP